MNSIFLMVFSIMMISFTGISYSYASCVAPSFGTPGPCFDSYMVSRDVVTEEYIMNHVYGYINVNYDNWEMSDRGWSNEDIGLDLPTIICTEFVVDGQTQYRMLKWEDAHTISSLENHRNDSLCDKWLPPMSDDLPICDQNPKHDLGKCQKIFEEPIFTLEQVSDICNATGFVSGEQKSWWNTTHFINSVDYEFYDKVNGSPTSSQIIDVERSSESKPDEISDEYVCGVGNIMVDGICVNPNLKYFDVGLNQIVLITFVVGIGVGITVFVIWRKRK